MRDLRIKEIETHQTSIKKLNELIASIDKDTDVLAKAIKKLGGKLDD